MRLRYAGTSLRDCARILASECLKRVIIVDTSNEIGGDGDIPHPSITTARRMQVSSRCCEKLFTASALISSCNGSALSVKSLVGVRGMQTKIHAA